MTSRIVAIFLFSVSLLTVDPVRAETSLSAEAVVKQLLSGEELSPKEQVAFALVEYQDPGKIKKLIAIAKLEASEEKYKQYETLYNDLYGKKNKEYTGAVAGLEVGWYLMSEGDTVMTLPLILKVAPNSAASDAKLRPGDVIDKMGGFELSGSETRNEFVALINNWPSSEPLVLEVTRSKTRDAASARTKDLKTSVSLFGGK